jgi:phosphoglycerate dehydrogenase-like enzyme
MSSRPTSRFVLNADAYDLIYGPEERAAIAAQIELTGPPLTAAAVECSPDLLADVDLIFSGWGMVPLDATLLSHAPRLAAVFYGAGSIRYFCTDALWERGIVVTSAYAANAVPVVEFTLAEILLSLKRVWYYSRAVRDLHGYPAGRHTVPGAYDVTVGLLALGTIGRLVAERLATFDLRVIAYDPFVSAADAAALGVELVSLDELFRRSQVVSLHAPWLPETEELITGAHLAAMPPDATFINTARGAIVREQEMIDVLRQRPDLFAVLDVTHPEPPAANSPLYTLPNVVLTPHLAGSLGRECRRMGRAMVDELRRYLAGEPLRWSITRTQAAHMA